MKEILSDINKWQMENQPIAIATVVQTWGSAPRKAGAKMAVTPNGRMAGSVSGGCVEGAVFEEAVATLKNNKPKLLHFGVADETAWEVGLACGGTIEVFVESLNANATALMDNLITHDKAGASITIIRGPEEMLGQKLTVARDGRQTGTLGPELDNLALTAEKKLQSSQRIQLTDEVEVFIDVMRPAPTLVMVGGVHIAIALIQYAKVLGYHTIVVDPRRAFGSEERFPNVDNLIQAWPKKAFAEIELTPETAVALLTHDPKIDDPALEVVLESDVFYIGALGSKKTHAKRIKRLQEKGISEGQIGRIHAPIGLNIHAATPEEIALSVIAEIVKTFRSV
ncbi:MAG: XdhC family protein [Chloroflexi bacterium]|nr:XdhC family protein [Chloroflexota bacterium]